MAKIELRARLEKNQGLFAIVDDDDLGLVDPYPWYVHRVKGSLTLYAKTQIGDRWVFMHHLIVGKKKKREVDHRDGDGLNNRRGNLWHVTHAVNLQAAFQRRRDKEFDAWFEEHMEHAKC